MKNGFTLALLLPALGGFAQTLTNDGATLSVSSGATLYVQGSLQNNAGSTLSNTGIVELTGDLTNAGTLAAPGKLVFSGSANQTFTPGSATVGTLVLASTGAVGQRTLSLPADLTVGSAFILQSGLLRTAASATLTLPDGATLSGEGPGQYVQGNLRIERAAGTGPLDFGHGAILDRSGLGQVTITRTAGLQTNNVSRAAGLGTPGAQGIDRIWTVETATPPAAAVPFTLQWVADDDNGISSFSTTQAWRAPLGSAAWAATGSSGAAAVSGSTRSFSFSTLALGRLTLGGLAAPLPVTLVAFTATPQGADALLRWTTASEKNNDRFEVEASADGRTFRRIGTVAGAGSSQTAHHYQLVDPAIAHYGTNLVYYRLRQVDTDDTAVYSPIRTVAVDLASQPAGLALFPNPTRTEATLTGAQPGAAVMVYDAVGRHVLNVTADADGHAALVLPKGVATGVYVVRTGSKALRLTVE
ncbi:T9SS type A sorting domain-containing protein [Hymenobacter properus]|uniref:T9SS type A sorting domain-containing protein n=1 Tax=Hymenobacter properus TaxID=2791026 RepID=A0A931BHE1_9BACT|nr:T9SS type A sorting domain-containing protein [Hymenobacter properus]MBF9140238.1 T9SS type A sorting domain-containing protein [Hymenobacter properus]MBR7719045.1 T9SS type A sorting domain-containing protein [Microvirga sp. SRT04]